MEPAFAKAQACAVLIREGKSPWDDAMAETVAKKKGIDVKDATPIFGGDLHGSGKIIGVTFFGQTTSTAHHVSRLGAGTGTTRRARLSRMPWQAWGRTSPITTAPCCCPGRSRAAAASTGATRSSRSP
tara:strand:- start:73 stop:456 length:384 start_codon:yes stop_codon:yes gene_type:complete